MKLRLWVLVIGASALIGCVDNPVSFSPDGKRVAYVRGKNLIVQEVARPEHKAVALTGNIARPQWSPDGGRILFLAGDQEPNWPSLYELSSHRVTRLPFRAFKDLAWRQDGSMLFGLRQTLVSKAKSREFKTDAVWYELASGKITRSVPINGEVEQPIWLTGETDVACIYEHDVAVLGRSAVRRLTREKGAFLIGVEQGSDRILAARVTKAGTKYRWVLERIDGVTGKRTGVRVPRLLERLGDDPRRLSYPLSFSPDGKWVVVSIWKQRSKGIGLRTFMLDHIAQLGVRVPDLRRSRGDQDSEWDAVGSCFLVRLDGRESRELMVTKTRHFVGSAIWSPNSETVALEAMLRVGSGRRDVIEVYRTNGSMLSELRNVSD
jgi:hypothetical protein